MFKLILAIPVLLVPTLGLTRATDRLIPNRQLVGSWARKEVGSSEEYQFYADGTGLDSHTYSAKKNRGQLKTLMKFRWSLKENVLSFTFLGYSQHGDERGTESVVKAARGMIGTTDRSPTWYQSNDNLKIVFVGNDGYFEIHTFQRARSTQ